MSARLLGAKQRFKKERFQLAKNLQSARCSPFVISKVLAARLRKSITARARKNNRTARMLANARKNHAIPLTVPLFAETNFLLLKLLANRFLMFCVENLSFLWNYCLS